MKRPLLVVVGLLAVGSLARGADPVRNPGQLKLALVNMKSLFSDGPDAAANRASIQANLKRHGDFIDRAAEQGADFVGFPEVSLNGYHFSKNMTWLKLDGPEVQTLARKAAEKHLHVSFGLAEEDADGKRWNTQVLIGPDGKIVGKHHKIWLTAEKGHVQKGAEHSVFDVKGMKMGICTCADGSDYKNLEALASAGAQIIYGPHANTTGSTIAGWYRFRSRWGGVWDGKYIMAPTSNEGPPTRVPSGGWIAHLKVHAALHNHAALYNPDFGAPTSQDSSTRWASGAWVISPEGKTLAQMPTSNNRADSKEYLLFCTIPLPKPSRP